MIPIVPEEETVTERARREKKRVSDIANERALRGILAIIFALLVVVIFYLPSNVVPWISAGLLIIGFIATICLVVNLRRKPF